MDNESSCIYSISSEQLNKISTYKEKWLSIAQESEAASPEELRHAIYYLYQLIDLDLPKIHIFDSPQLLQQTLKNKHFYRRVLLKRFIKILRPFYTTIMLVWLYAYVTILPHAIFISIKIVLSSFISFYYVFGFILITMITERILFRFFSRQFRMFSRWFDLYGGWFFIACLSIITCINLLIAEYSWESGSFFFTKFYIFGIVLSYLVIEIPKDKNLFTDYWKSLLNTQIETSLCPQAYQQALEALKGDWATPWEKLGKTVTAEEAPGFPSNQCDMWQWIRWFAWADFCITELGCDCDHRLWQSLKIIITSCSTITADRHACYISDRPLHIHIDAQHRLHAKDKPAVSFADNTHFYYRHGKRLTLPDLPW
jgi:hypothetical protein